MTDLFETPELIPNDVKSIIDSYTDIDDYNQCEELKEQLNKIGYTIDYDLSAQPFNLRKL